MEAKLLRCLYSLPETLYRADFSGKAQLAQNHDAVAYRQIRPGGVQGCGKGGVDCAFLEPLASGDIYVQIHVRKMQTCLLFKNRGDTGDTGRIDFVGVDAGNGRLRGNGERLDFHDESAAPLEYAGVGDSRRSLVGALRYEHGAGVLHALKAGLAHREKPELVDGAESVLARAEKADFIVVALERNHCVHHVLQGLRACYRPLFRDVGRHYHHAVALLHPADELVRAVFELVDGSGHDAGLNGIDGLDGIDDDEDGIQRDEGVLYVLKPHRAEDFDSARVEVETVRPALYLPRALLA